MVGIPIKQEFRRVVANASGDCFTTLAAPLTIKRSIRGSQWIADYLHALSIAKATKLSTLLPSLRAAIRILKIGTDTR